MICIEPREQVPEYRRARYELRAGRAGQRDAVLPSSQSVPRLRPSAPSRSTSSTNSVRNWLTRSAEANAVRIGDLAAASRSAPSNATPDWPFPSPCPSSTPAALRAFGGQQRTQTCLSSTRLAVRPNRPSVSSKSSCNTSAQYCATQPVRAFYRTRFDRPYRNSTAIGVSATRRAARRPLATTSTSTSNANVAMAI